MNLNKNIFVPEKAQIVEIKQLTQLEKYFKIKLLERNSLNHKPGQFVMVTVYGVGEAPISVSSPPEPNSNEFELVVRKVGTVTYAMHNLKIGDIIGIRGPYGTYFSAEKFKSKDLLFIAGGIGIAPLRSFIKEVLKEANKYRKITILYGAKSPSYLLFLDEMKKWQKNKNVTISITVDEPDNNWNGNVGVITTLIPMVEIDSLNTLVTIVGPPVMYKFVLLALMSKKIPDENIYLSFERKMQCGIGKCGNCQIQNLYACIDGPVFCWANIKYLEEAL